MGGRRRRASGCRWPLLLPHHPVKSAVAKSPGSNRSQTESTPPWDEAGVLGLGASPTLETQVSAPTKGREQMPSDQEGGLR